MEDLKTFRRDWSDRQKTLRKVYQAGSDLKKARDLFYSQHAVLHSQKMSGMAGWSYADAIFSDLTESRYRVIPEKKDHSLIWILWHISRIEDITMNVLVSGGSQVYLRDQWKRKLASPIDHVGNQIKSENLLTLTQTVKLKALFEYRDAVGKQTRSVVRGLERIKLEQKVQPDRLARLVNENAVLSEAEGLLDYWGKRKIYGMLLMPPTRHLMTHLNEAYALRCLLERR